MAAGIKGIVIDIGGNTAPLNKALSDVNKTSRNLQNELKQVDKLLKLDPKNTELLAQKQKILSEQIESTSNKLNTLKEAESQVQEQFKKGEASEEQYRALQREIIKTEEELKALEKTAEQSNGTLGKVAEVSSKIGEKTEKAGKAMLPVSAGIAAIGAASVASFNELDEGYDTIITKTGATGEVLDRLNSSMDAVFSELPTTAGNAGIAVGEVNTRFGATGKLLEDLSKEFIQFAEINETDLNNSIGTTKKVMEAWNIEAEETPNVLGLITSKAQETGISVDTLMNSALENNSVFKEMGLTFEQSIGLLAEFEKNGVNSTTAITGLKKAVINYAKEGLSMEEGLQKTIDSIKNAKTETEALSIAQEIFGTKGAAEMSNAIREGRISVDDLCTSMSEYGTTVEDTFNATLDAPDKAAVAFNNLKLAGAELGDTILTALTPVIEKVVEKVKSFSQWFSNLSDGSKTAAASIGGIVAAIGPALIAFGKMATGVSSAISAMKKIGTVISTVKTAISSFNIIQTAQAAATKAAAAAQAMLNAVMNANPIALIVIAIAGLVAAFVLLWNKCEGFRNFFIELWENIKSAFQAFIDWISPAIETIKGYFQGLWEKLQEIWAYITESLQPLKEAISGAFQTAWEIIQSVWNLAQPYFAAVWETIQIIFSVVATYLGGMFETAWAAIKAVWDTVTGYFRAVWETIKGIFSVVKSVLSGNWSEAWEAIKGIVSSWAAFFSDVWDSIKAVFSSVGSWFSDTFSAAWTAVKNVFSTWGSFFSGLWDTIKNTFSNLGTSIANAIGNAVKLGINGVISIIENTINRAINLINGAIGLINKIPGVNIGRINEIELPRLAKGAIIKRPTIAEIGENGQEAVVPLENNIEWIDKLADRINQSMQESANKQKTYGESGISGVSESREAVTKKEITVNNHNYGLTAQTAYEVSETTRRTLNALSMQGVL